MPLRLHFTTEDLARTTVAGRPDPLWELVLSLHILQSSSRQAGHARWRREARNAIAARQLYEPVRELTTLVAARGDFPDFLTPVGDSGFPAALETILSTPGRRLFTELTAIFARRRAPSWVRRLAEGDPDVLRRLGQALALYYNAVVEPYLDQAENVIAADRELRLGDTLSGGISGMLGGLPYPMRWNEPVLEASYPVDRDLHLGGRGLILIPSFFCTRSPVTFIDPGLTPVLVYPALGGAVAAAPRAAVPGGLAGLVGRSRANMLVALRIAGSTTQLAERTRLSAASASKHAAALRGAGLVESVRRGNTITHTLTPLGRALLEANSPPAATGAPASGPRPAPGSRDPGPREG